MGGTLTSLRPDRKPVVLWTPWGSIPKTGSRGHRARRGPVLPNVAEPPPLPQCRAGDPAKPS